MHAIDSIWRMSAVIGTVLLIGVPPPAWAGDGACCFPSGACAVKPDEHTCHERGGTQFFSGKECHEVDCGGRTTADCSPGYYKNHVEEWCSTNPDYPGSDLSRNCASGAECGALLEQLRARGPGSEAIRRAAKGVLDTCFRTASASPCEDDD